MVADFVASRSSGLITVGVIMYAIIGVLLIAAALYLVWLSVHRPASSRAHFLKKSEEHEPNADVVRRLDPMLMAASILASLPCPHAPSCSPYDSFLRHPKSRKPF